MNDLLAALVNGFIAGGVTTGILWTALRLIPRNKVNAATRYALWWTAMVIVLALPIFFVPGHDNPPAVPSVATPMVIVQPPLAPMVPPHATTAVPPPPIAARTTSAPGMRWPTFPIQIPATRWLNWIFVAWLTTALLFLFRLTVSFVLLYRLRARAFTAPGTLAERIQQWHGSFASSPRPIGLNASRDVATPVAIGPWHPSILIPETLFEELESAELSQIGLHEAAHFVRRDDYALVLQRIIEALFAAHPVVRWIARQLDLEREIACDDLVVASTGNPVSYAACLVRIVALSAGIRTSYAAVAAAEDSSHLSRRVDVLLDKTRHTGTLLLKGRFAAMVVIVTLLALAIGKVSSIIAFAAPFAPTRANAVQVAPVARVTLLPQAAVERTDQSPDLVGRVLEDSSGNPLASAELRFHKAGVPELAADLETDRLGRFTAPGLAPGDYTVDAVKPNYVTTTFKLHVPSGSPLIRLVRYGVIDGQAMDTRGKPLPDRILEPGGRTGGSTRITVLVKTPGSDALQTFRETFPEDTGHYRIYDLPPGEYALGIWYYGLNDGSGMQLYPDNSHPRLFTVSGGEEYNNINFVVVSRPSWRVSGKVMLPEGVKGQFQLALGMPDQPTLPVSQTLSEKDGSFRFEKIPAGTYDLFVAGPTSGYTAYQSILGRGDPLYGRTRVDVSGQNLEDLSVPVSAGRAVKVMLRNADGASAMPEGCPATASVTVTSLEPWGTMFTNRATAQFGKELTISNLAPGRFTVDAIELGAGCFQVKHPVVDLRSDVSEAAVIELASAGSIKGVMRGKGGFAVVLMDAAATRGAQARLAYPDSNGRFAFEGLPPARYRISAQPADAARARWVDATASREIEVSGGAPTNVELGAPVPQGGR